MAHTIFEASSDTLWQFEPEEASDASFSPTGALPGTDEKLAVLARRLRSGLPLWHPADRRSFRDNDLE